jgi:hypothetical protein
MSNNNEGCTPALGDAQARKLLDAPPDDTLKGVRDPTICHFDSRIHLNATISEPYFCRRFSAGQRISQLSCGRRLSALPYFNHHDWSRRADGKERSGRTRRVDACYTFPDNRYIIVLKMRRGRAHRRCPLRAG